MFSHHQTFYVNKAPVGSVYCPLPTSYHLVDLGLDKACPGKYY